MDLEKQLASEEFDIGRHMKHVAFHYDGSTELKQHKKRVQGVADQTAQKLKQNVYQNYALFIDTSKEISSLEAEMYQLSHLLHEHEVLTHSLQALTVTEDDRSGTQAESAEKHEKQSIASLLEMVEGCSSITEVHGRYLVHSSHLVELDQESYEAVQLVRAFLLNDSLMIGSLIKKRRGPVRYRFEALYELDNMAVVDVKDTDVVQNAFKILMFPDSHLYQAERLDSKREWIGLLDSTKQKHKAAREAVKPDASIFTRRRVGSVDQEWEKLRGEMRQAEGMSADWLKDVPETLDVYIAQREFGQAVTLIEETKAHLKDFSDSHALRDVRARLNHRTNLLSKVLMKELEASPSGSLRGGPRAARRAVGLLLRLGRSAKACELFLENHSQIIRRGLDDVKMEGTTSLYIGNLSSAFFDGLHNAASEFVRAFGENNGSYSAFVVWCHNQLRYFTRKSVPLIFSNVQSMGKPAECLAVAFKECDTLTSIGIDLTFALRNLYHPYVYQAIDATRNHIIEEVGAKPEDPQKKDSKEEVSEKDSKKDSESKKEDSTEKSAEGGGKSNPDDDEQGSWSPLDLRNDQPRLAAIVIDMENQGISDFRNLIYDGGVVDLSFTTVRFCKLMLNFMNDVMRFYYPEILELFIDCFSNIFESVMERYVRALEKSLVMVESISGDARFVCDTVLPCVGAKVNEFTGKNLQELVELHTRLKTKLEECIRKKSQSANLEPGPGAAMRVDAQEFGEEEEEEEPVEDIAGDRTESDESGDSRDSGTSEASEDSRSDLGEEFEGSDDEDMIA